MNLPEIARNVGIPSRANCGKCHFYGGGGDAIKHGALDSTFEQPDRKTDVHMGGMDFSCQYCHLENGHRIAGGCTTCAVSEGTVSCLDCHDERPHYDENPLLAKLNDHVDSISCQTCHIPTFAKNKPTLMCWDWSKAGKEMEPCPVDPHAITICSKKKGLLIKKQNLTPVYSWYNGKHHRYLAGDKVNLNGTTYLNKPDGNIRDPNSKITPYKIYEGIQPADDQFGYLIVPKLWGGFWRHFDWNRAAEEGMNSVNLKYSGKIRFVKTIMHWAINHGVAPKEQALSCTDCHRPDGVMDFKALGYKRDPVVIGGRFKNARP